MSYKITNQLAHRNYCVTWYGHGAAMLFTRKSDLKALWMQGDDAYSVIEDWRAYNRNHSQSDALDMALEPYSELFELPVTN